MKSHLSESTGDVDSKSQDNGESIISQMQEGKAASTSVIVKTVRTCDPRNMQCVQLSHL